MSPALICVDGGTVYKQYYRDPLGIVYLFSLNRKRSDADVVLTPGSNSTLVSHTATSSIRQSGTTVSPPIV